MIWDNDVSGHRFEEWASIRDWTSIWVYHIYIYLKKNWKIYWSDKVLPVLGWRTSGHHEHSIIWSIKKTSKKTKTSKFGRLYTYSSHTWRRWHMWDRTTRYIVLYWCHYICLVWITIWELLLLTRPLTESKKWYNKVIQDKVKLYQCISYPSPLNLDTTVLTKKMQ